MFTLRLATSHHSFSLKRSVATRSTEDFYQLQVTPEFVYLYKTSDIIQSWLSGHTGHHPRLSVPSLPPRLMMAVFSRPRQAAVLARSVPSSVFIDTINTVRVCVDICDI